jgi:hypothetical protein
MRKTATILLAAVGAAASLPALAQTNPYANRSWQQPREAYGSYHAGQPGYSSRATGPYSSPRGYDGTIHWNTPNKDGNFGNASGGGVGNNGGG